MNRGGTRSSSSSRGMLPLLALHAFSEFSRLQKKPPITAGLLAANTLIYMRPGALDSILPLIDEVWFNPHLIVKNHDLKRLILSAFYHVNEPHLVYNMLSLLWKGVQLEESVGSLEFASMVAMLVALSQGITLLLAKSLLVFLQYDKPYYREYAVGFSAVLFAMKVVLSSASGETHTYAHGMMIPTRYAAWVELILIQMMVPGVSFLGHLGGILAGLLYLKLRHAGSGMDPLTRLAGGILGIFRWPARFVGGCFGLRRGVFGRGRVGGRRNGRSASGFWRCGECTYDNSGWLSVCEMCGSSNNGDGAHGGELRVEELRRRRIERFGR